MKLLYDGDCPLCMREVNMLRRRDEGTGRIAFVDIADPAYDPAAHGGISFRAAMERIHALLPDGRVLTDVEVFRVAYEQVGLGWVYAATRVPAILRAANAVYGVWAKYRLPLTLRPDLEVVLAEKRTCGAGGGATADGGPKQQAS
jgi:predicted DCC family thiol-disulfide oxidoreductase YuxK